MTTTDALRALARELRALVDDAQRRFGEVRIEAPSFRDEDGDERALPDEFATATMGHVLLAQGRSDEALAVFRAVLARSPDDEDALRGVALLGA
jgi:Flp pilus assembly protein TadD